MALDDVRRSVQQACARAGRVPSSVRLIAVSKLQPGVAIRKAYEAGQRDFGENYAQELRDKAEGLSGLSGLVWHALGPLQLNKVKYVAKVATYFHALDRLEVGEALSKRRLGSPLRCFVEVNVGAEKTKSGVGSSQVAELVDKLKLLPNLEIVGLMCMPPLGEVAESSRPYFKALAVLAQSLGLRELSMGSTVDYEVAIEEGATWVRVGTAVFGDRQGDRPGERP